MNLFIGLVGLLATATSSVASPSQVLNVFRMRHSAQVIDAVSGGTVVLVAAKCGIWGVYGTQHGAVWTAVLAALDFTTYLLISGLLFLYAKKWLLPVVAILTAAAAAAVTAMLPQLAAGLLGTALAAVMFYPQAVRIWRVRGTAGVYGFSALSAWMMIVSSVLWILYAAMIVDPLVALSCPLIIGAGATILWARASGARSTAPAASPAATAHPKAPPLSFLRRGAGAATLPTPAEKATVAGE